MHGIYKASNTHFMSRLQPVHMFICSHAHSSKVGIGSICKGNISQMVRWQVVTIIAEQRVLLEMKEKILKQVEC